jgi:hypothetical protein
VGGGWGPHAGAQVESIVRRVVRAAAAPKTLAA